MAAESVAASRPRRADHGEPEPNARREPSAASRPWQGEKRRFLLLRNSAPRSLKSRRADGATSEEPTRRRPKETTRRTTARRLDKTTRREPSARSWRATPGQTKSRRPLETGRAAFLLQRNRDAITAPKSKALFQFLDGINKRGALVFRQ